MSPSRETIDASYAFCRRVARRAGSNLTPSFLVLPKAKRRAMHALYAFTRRTDDLVDNPQPDELRRRRLIRWRALLDAALDDPSGRPLPNRQDDHESAAILPALADTARRFEIPGEHLRAVVDGVQMDLDRRRYETFDELAGYCHRVASAVGLACIYIWGFRGPEAFEPARDCGIAMQLTNILRDLKEDARCGRIYLPQDDLQRCRYSPEDLAAGVADERFDRLVELEADRARGFYHTGAELIDLLEPDGRRVFGLMISVYHRLLEAIARRPREIFLRRISLPRWQRFGIAVRWTLLPPQRSDLP